MPVARFQMPDGRIARFEVPEGTTPGQAQEMISAQFSAPTRDPNEVDPVTGKTRAQLESENQQAQANNKPLPWYQSNAMRETVRHIGRTGRDAGFGGLQGVTGLADIAMLPINAPGWALNKLRSPTASELITGKQEVQLFPLSNALSKGEQAIMNRADPSGTTLPQSATERLLSGATRATSGTLLTAGLGGGSGSFIKAPLEGTKAGAFLSSNPGMQVASAITGSTAAGVTRELGGGEGAQFAAGLLGGFAPSAAKYGFQRILGEPSPEARVLLSKGADLTPGQQRPGGKWSQMEDAIQDWPLVGPSIKASKENAAQQAKESFLIEGAAPGAVVKPTGDLHKTLEEVAKTFDPAYENVSGFPIKSQGGKPVIFNNGQNVPLNQAIAKVIADKSIDATAASRREAASWLGNLLTRRVKTSEDLLSMRSELRSRIREMAMDSTESAAKREIYKQAEQKITDVLTSQLPEKALQNLADIDKQYAKHMVGVDAMAKAKDRPGGFTWNEASTAAQKSSVASVGKKGYAKGQGFMRDTPAAAAKVFAQTPPTGARAIAHAAGIPLVLPITLGTTSKAFREFMANNRKAPYQPPVAAFGSFIPQDQ